MTRSSAIAELIALPFYVIPDIAVKLVEVMEWTDD